MNSSSCAGRRQLAVQQQVADLHEGALLGELLHGVAAIQQHALVAVDVGDLALAARGGAEAGVVGEQAVLGDTAADVDDVRPDGAGAGLELDLLARRGIREGVCLSAHLPTRLPIVVNNATRRAARAERGGHPDYRGKLPARSRHRERRHYESVHGSPRAGGQREQRQLGSMPGWAGGRRAAGSQASLYFLRNLSTRPPVSSELLLAGVERVAGRSTLRRADLP